jgi:hypothetical protein
MIGIFRNLPRCWYGSKNRNTLNFSARHFLYPYTAGISNAERFINFII